MAQTTPGSDPIYKRLYGFPEMVADLLRSVLPADTLGTLDLGSLTKVPADYVGDDFRKRHGDTVWRLRMPAAQGAPAKGEHWLYVVVLLEFQSSNDSIMALRVAEYTTMLYKELLRSGAAHPGRLPPALPVVLYNGESPWRAARNTTGLLAPFTAALAPYQLSQRYLLLDERHSKADDAQALTQAVMLLEQSRSPRDLARPAALLTRLLAAPAQAELRRAFADWLWVLYSRLRRDKEPPSRPADLTLEDMTMTLEERVARWPDQWIRQGVEQGLRQGVEQGLRQGVEQGLRQGVEQGLRQGLGHERTLLRRMAEVRFGASTADQLSASLRQVHDPRQLDAIGEAIMRSETGDELLRQANPDAPAKPAPATPNQPGRPGIGG